MEIVISNGAPVDRRVDVQRTPSSVSQRMTSPGLPERKYFTLRRLGTIVAQIGSLVN